MEQNSNQVPKKQIPEHEKINTDHTKLVDIKNQAPQKQIPEYEKINTLIMLGNGYDLTYGYKTSYNDFIKSSYFTEKKTDNDLFWQIDNKDKHENWSDLETLLFDHAKALERELNQVALPDNGIAPLPKRGEAGDLITDFKKEYKILNDQLCQYLYNATKKDANPKDPTKIKIEDYSFKEISSILRRIDADPDVSLKIEQVYFERMRNCLKTIRTHNNDIEKNIEELRKSCKALRPLHEACNDLQETIKQIIYPSIQNLNKQEEKKDVEKVIVDVATKIIVDAVSENDIVDAVSENDKDCYTKVKEALVNTEKEALDKVKEALVNKEKKALDKAKEALVKAFVNKEKEAFDKAKEALVKAKKAIPDKAIKSAYDAVAEAVGKKKVDIQAAKEMLTAQKTILESNEFDKDESLKEIKESITKISTTVEELYHEGNNPDDFGKIALKHIKSFITALTKEMGNVTGSLSSDFENLKNIKESNDDSSEKRTKLILEYSKITGKCKKITEYHEEIQHICELRVKYTRMKKNLDEASKPKDPTSKQKSIDNLDSIQKEILKVLIAYRNDHHGHTFDELQEKWINSCCEKTYIITFNYTDLTGCLKDLNDNKKEVIYVHGRLLKEKNSRVVLGIDENMKVHRAFNFLHKSYQPGLDINRLTDKLKDVKRFIIYGCSVGSTDKWYFEHILKDENGRMQKNRVFEIYYYNDDDRSSIQNYITNIIGDLMEFQTKNLVFWIRTEGSGLRTAITRREKLDNDELKYLGLK